MLMKLKSNLIILLIFNILLLFLAIYGFLGTFWVWQPGASPPQLVPLFGAQSYLQSLKNRGYNVTLVYGFLTYRVDIWANGVQSLDVVRFDWAQFSLVLLAVVDIWVLIGFLKSRNWKIWVKKS